MVTVKEVSELTSKVVEALKPIGDKIGQGAKAVYIMAVKDAFITGILSAVYCGLSVIVFLWAALSITGNVAAATNSDNSEGVQVFSVVKTIFCGAAMLISFLTFTGYIGEAFHYLLNPEYMALKDLLKTLK